MPSKFHQTMRAGSKGSGPAERRVPAKFVVGPGGVPCEQSDPRGYWHGQHTNPVRAQRRRNIQIAGGVRQFKRVERLLKGL